MLTALCALYADIDDYKLVGNPIAQLSPEAESELILAHLDARAIPRPSLVLDTCRDVEHPHLTFAQGPHHFEL